MVPPCRLSPAGRAAATFGAASASFLPVGPGEKITSSIQLASVATVLKWRYAANGLWSQLKVTSADALCVEQDLLSRQWRMDLHWEQAGQSEGRGRRDCLRRETMSCFYLFRICGRHQLSVISRLLWALPSPQPAKFRGGRPGLPANKESPLFAGDTQKMEAASCQVYGQILSQVWWNSCIEDAGSPSPLQHSILGQQSENLGFISILGHFLQECEAWATH